MFLEEVKQFLFVSLGFVRLSPLDTSAIVWPIVLAQDDGR
jgi:hypothetical protein